MKISEILEAMRIALAEWAKPLKGTVQVAGDPFHLFSLLAAKPGSVRVCLLADSGQKRGEYEEAGQEDSAFVVVVSRGRGFPLDPGASLQTGSAGGAPLFDLVEQIRDVVRGIDVDPEATEFTFDFKRWGKYSPPFESLTDAYQLEFTIGRQLPGITSGATSFELGLAGGNVLGVGAESVLGIS